VRRYLASLKCNPSRADTPRVAVAAQPLGHRHLSARRVQWRRLSVAAAATAAVVGADLWWKATALATAHGGVEVHSPGSALRPALSLLVGLVALSGVVLLPPLCVPGAVLAFAGISSNIASLAIWGGVPNPLSLQLGGGVLDLNLADLCLWGGCLLFLAGVFTTLVRMPADAFA
jgi:hypothetical protein